MFRIMPDFVDFQNLIAFLDGFRQLHVTPGTENSSLLIGMGTGVLVQGIGTGLTQGEHEFILCTVRKDGVEQAFGG